MGVIFFILPIALLFGFCFLVTFIVMAKSGQFDDLETPAYRLLFDEVMYKVKKNKKEEKYGTR